MGSLADDIEQVLHAAPGSTAREITRLLASRRLTKADVNSTLYRNRSRFVSSGDSPPTWRCRCTLAPPPRPQLPLASGWTRHAPCPLYAWQLEALQAWEAQGHRGVVEAVTGTGKTMVGLVAVRERLSSGAKAAILVPSIPLQSQWQALVQELCPAARVGLLGGGGRGDLANLDVLIAVANSARTKELGNAGPGALVVVDECHRFGSETNQLALEPQFERRLGLSATHERGDGGNEAWLEPYFGRTCFRMGYERAIHDDVTAHFSVTLVGVAMPPQERVLYDQLSDRCDRAMKRLRQGGI